MRLESSKIENSFWVKLHFVTYNILHIEMDTLSKLLNFDLKIAFRLDSNKNRQTDFKIIWICKFQLSRLTFITFISIFLPIDQLNFQKFQNDKT